MHLFAWCREEAAAEVWSSEWVRGQLWCLPMSQDEEWCSMYLVRYLGAHHQGATQFEHGDMSVKKHHVQFFGSPHVTQSRMPKNPPLLYPAFLSQVDFRNGNPRILFTEKHESCSAYTGVVTERELIEGERVFDDGSQPCSEEGRRLTLDSWNRIVALGVKYNRQLSFNLK